MEDEYDKLSAREFLGYGRRAKRRPPRRRYWAERLRSFFNGALWPLALFMGIIHEWRRVIIGILILVGVISIPLVWESDVFQRTFFPEKYWTSEVQHLEDRLRSYEREGESGRLELDKQRRVTDIELQQRRLEGMSAQEAAENFELEQQILRDVDQMFAEMLKETRIALAHANRELERVRRDRAGRTKAAN